MQTTLNEGRGVVPAKTSRRRACGQRLWAPLNEGRGVVAAKTPWQERRSASRIFAQRRAGSSPRQNVTNVPVPAVRTQRSTKGGE